MTRFLCTAMVATFAASSLQAQTYSCSIQPPRTVEDRDGKVSMKEIGLPPEISSNRNFTVEISKKGPSEGLAKATVTWAGDPMQVAGEFLAIPTAEDAISIMTFSPGPCLYTERMCIAMITIVDQLEGSAKLQILPSGVTTLEKGGRAPLLVAIEGQCAKGTDK